MKRYFHFILFFFFCIDLTAQAPVVTAQIGYPVGQSASDAAWGNSKYLVLSTGNRFYSSGDLSNWSYVITSGVSPTQLNGMVFGAGLFVVIGNSGTIQSSADGITWTTRTSGTTETLRRIYFINSTFLAIGDKRTLLSSADGITWSAVAFNAGVATQDFMSLSFGNGVYVLSARSAGSGNYIYRSATATSNSWTYYSNPMTVSESINRVEFLKDKFWGFIVGSNIYTSADGITWTNITGSVSLTQPDLSTTTFGSGHQIFNGIYDGSKYIFYGSSAYYSGYGSSFVSVDGLNFTLLNKTAYIVPQESTILNGVYFVTGNEGFVTSSDGLTYAHSGSSYSDMVKADSKYIAVGSIGSDGQIYNSPDFLTWTKRTPLGVREFYCAGYDGTVTLAAGTGMVYSSANNGDTWSNVFVDPTVTFSCMTYGNSRFLTAGWDGSGYFIKSSVTQGVSWTTVNTDNIYVLKMKTVNGKFFALGQDGVSYLGRILYSADGSTWSDITPSTGWEVLYYKDITFDGTKYHLLGIESSSYTPTGFFTLSTSTPSVGASFSGKTECTNLPEGAVLGGSWDQGMLEMANGKLTGSVIDVATGQDYIIYSEDGNSWTCVAQNSFSTLMTGVVTGTDLKVLSRSNAFFNISYSGTLPVSLQSFSAVRADKQVRVSWTTTFEQQIRKYIVQRSSDANSWSDIGTVMPCGSETGGTYRFTDDMPVEGTGYYRLKTENMDGSAAFSMIQVVHWKQPFSMKLLPVPATNQLFVSLNNPERVVITVLNAAGQQVMFTTSEGSGKMLDISVLPAGRYIIVVTDGRNRESSGFIKQ
ncbi:MAG: T9SS type A sorting domain-containing protein [Chitinophagales bacterium]|nr:T9SS type A sorting domain-containing protein [Chitinophagales bacterium]